MAIYDDDDGQNLALATSRARVDALNGEFYGAIRYPGPPAYFERVADPGFWAAMLDQDLARWDAPVLPGGRGRVWVPGCGTNQAVITALMFPQAQVVGSDLSVPSLEMAERNARQLGVENLTLRGESLFNAPYAEEFDYVICTGVVGHTAEPAAALARVAAALRPAGVMQLMVYNRYHRAVTSAFQKAVRAMLGRDGHAYEEELALARRFVHHYAGPGKMAAWLSGQRDRPEAHLADTLIQPVEHSYTVESLAQMAADAGLELLAPCPNAHDAAAGTLHWEMEMGDAELQRAYDALPDARRWQVTNLMLQDESPMLWFYLQRTDAPRPRARVHAGPLRGVPGPALRPRPHRAADPPGGRPRRTVPSRAGPGGPLPRPGPQRRRAAGGGGGGPPGPPPCHPAAAGHRHGRGAHGGAAAGAGGVYRPPVPAVRVEGTRRSHAAGIPVHRGRPSQRSHT
jgi:SAM-dependent methyltransferase